MELLVAKGRDQLVFSLRDGTNDRPLLELFGINIHAAADLPDEGLLVVAVIDGKPGIHSHRIDVAAQNPHAHGMERGDPDALRAKADEVIHALTHLPGRLIGKGNRQDIPWIDAAFLHQIGNAVCDHTGLAAASSCQDQNRSLCVTACLPLLFIQSIIYAHVVISSSGICELRGEIRACGFSDARSVLAPKAAITPGKEQIPSGICELL